MLPLSAELSARSRIWAKSRFRCTGHGTPGGGTTAGRKGRGEGGPERERLRAGLAWTRGAKSRGKGHAPHRYLRLNPTSGGKY